MSAASDRPIFIDSAKIHIKAGDGGKGCCSFHKDKMARYPRPSGGSGGSGGNIIIRADCNIDTLLDFQYRRHFRADRGGLGGPNNRQGEVGKDCIILVPVGTEVFDADKNLISDLTEALQEITVAKGGKGGRGNYGLKGEIKYATLPVEAGEECDLILELKLLADVGVIGYPNAGKSSFVSRVSGAKLKIADYPFTTKSPHLGVVRYKEESDFVIADIPGLIEGAHQGRGLGDRFLKHIERTRILLHLVDISGSDGRDPLDNYNLLNNELDMYGHNLAEKPQIIAANKMDLPSSKDNLKKIKKDIKKKIYPISCKTGEGIDDLLKALNSAVRK